MDNNINITIVGIEIDPEYIKLLEAECDRLYTSLGISAKDLYDPHSSGLGSACRDRLHQENIIDTSPGLKRSQTYDR